MKAISKIGTITVIGAVVLLVGFGSYHSGFKHGFDSANQPELMTVTAFFHDQMKEPQIWSKKVETVYVCHTMQTYFNFPRPGLTDPKGDYITVTCDATDQKVEVK